MQLIAVMWSFSRFSSSLVVLFSISGSFLIGFMNAIVSPNATEEKKDKGEEEKNIDGYININDELSHILIDSRHRIDAMIVAHRARTRIEKTISFNHFYLLLHFILHSHIF